MLTARYISIFFGICFLLTSCGRDKYIYFENVTSKPITILAKSANPHIPTAIEYYPRDSYVYHRTIDTVIDDEHWLRCYLESGDELIIGRVDTMLKEPWPYGDVFYPGTMLEVLDTNSIFYSQLVIEYDTSGYSNLFPNGKDASFLLPHGCVRIVDSLGNYTDLPFDTSQYALHFPGRSIYSTRVKIRNNIQQTRNIFDKVTGWKMKFVPEAYKRYQEIL